MTFTSLLSAIVGTLLNPFSVIFGLLLIGALLMTLGRKTIGQVIISLAALYLLVPTVLPVDEWLLRPLENRFPRLPLPAHVDGILVLDGGMNAEVVATRGTFSTDTGILRLVAAGNVFRRFPNARFVYTGSLFGRAENTNIVARILFGDMGIEPGRVIVENTARSTWENFLLSKELAEPKKGETWVLVTSALHMPRALGIAQHLGWEFVPWASEYITTNDNRIMWRRATEDRLRFVNMALHEWVGLIAYRLAGRTDILFPAPEENDAAS